MVNGGLGLRARSSFQRRVTRRPPPPPRAARGAAKGGGGVGGGTGGASAPPPAARDAARPGPGAVERVERAVSTAVVSVVVAAVDGLYAGDSRAYARFYALETVARVPYFAFLSVLHLYETLGWHRRADYLKVHFAQSINELHHLMIMEELGGNARWRDRALAQHVAVAYFGVCCALYALSPRMAYGLNELVEEHAYHTYDKFLGEREAELRALPAPAVAKRYYETGDLYLFDEFQSEAVRDGDYNERRRPVIETLYDTFVNVRNDEYEHMRTMQACQQPGAILSPSDVMACAQTSVPEASGQGHTFASATAAAAEGRPAAALTADDGCVVDGGPCGQLPESRTCAGVLDCINRAPTGVPVSQKEGLRQQAQPDRRR